MFLTIKELRKVKGLLPQIKLIYADQFHHPFYILHLLHLLCAVPAKIALMEAVSLLGKDEIV